MAITRIGDAKVDEDAWREARKNYLTSSSVFTWVGEDIPSWWGDTRESILEEKHGQEKQFDSETETTICHGVHSEDNVIAKFQLATGLPCEGVNTLWANDDIPGVAASIDGFCFPQPGEVLFPEISQDREHMQGVVDQLCGYDKVILECKRSTSTKWQTQVPEYYIPQLQTQMWVLDLPAAVIVADTIKRGETMKWRWFWDMRAYVVVRDPAWEEKLKVAGQEFLAAMEERQ